MKKLYFLDEEEKNRNLNLYERATKRQYLGEQTKPTQAELDKREARWDSDLNCVKKQPNAIKKILADKTTSYQIGKIIYYNTGRKSENGKMLNYSCTTEFIPKGERQTNITKVYCSVKNGMITTGSLKNTKWDEYVKSFGVTSIDIETAKKSCPKTNNLQQTRQQIVTKTTDTTKQIQALLGLTETGVMDSGLLQKINDKLNGKPQEAPKSDVATQPRPQVEPLQTSLKPAGVVQQQLTTPSPEQLTAGLQQMQQKAAATAAGLKR